MRSDVPEPPAPLPQIIPRPEHSLSRKDVTVEALKVLYRLHHTGFKAYLVGGSVRDLLLGKLPKDFDVATDARPGEIRKLFRNSRIIGKRFRLVQVFFRGGKIVEVSTFRCRSEFDDTPEATLARNNTFGTPAEDANRRDLTINGLFYNIADFSLVDYVGGLEDLKRGYIRVIGEPGVRFQRDPVRMLRVLRHAARIGFTIDPAAWQELLAKGHLISLCPASRLRDELSKDLRSGAARPFFNLMFTSRLFYAIFPTWSSRLGRSGEKGLVELLGRVDTLIRAERLLSESLLWAIFLTPYLEPETLPENLKEKRDIIQNKVREALGGIEFPRQRQEEVSQLLTVAAAILPFLRQKRPLPARLTRLAAYPEAMLLQQIKTAPLDELLERIPQEEMPPPVPRSKRRRVRRRFRGPRRPPGP